jgi:RimJ/RimL family protein N-acetyltransferase
LLSGTLALLHDAGVGRALAVIDASNAASLRAFARAGYRPTGLLRVGRYRLNRWSSAFAEERALADTLWVQATTQSRAKPPSLR